MNSPWQSFLLEQGACLDEAGSVLNFGNAAAERRAARDAGVIVPLTHLGLIGCSGEDAKSFLQGQLSNDIGQVTAVQGQFSSYCSPKGRMLASLLVWQEPGGYFLQLSRDLQPAVRKRIGMFVMRAKVKFADESDGRITFGLSGSPATAALKPFFAEIPAEAQRVVHSETNGTLIALPGGRFQLVTTPEGAMRLWPSLASTLAPAGAACWQWLDIRNGLPLVTEATQEKFVPQMANLELIGGVSFKKGCYPGQEIVARTQYRGQLKRRMVLAHLAGNETTGNAGEVSAPRPGNELFSAGTGDQAAGMVVNAEAAPDGGYDLLAVVQTASAEEDALRLGSLSGPMLHIQALPYAVPLAESTPSTSV